MRSGFMGGPTKSSPFPQIIQLGCWRGSICSTLQATTRPSSPEAIFSQGLRFDLGYDAADCRCLRSLCPGYCFHIPGTEVERGHSDIWLLAFTVLVGAIGNPLGWLLYSTGRVGRSIKMSLVSTPIMISAYALALPYGPRGVAFAYSAWMVLWIVPAIVWATHGTGISSWEILLNGKWPLASCIIAAGVSFGLRYLYGQLLPCFPRLLIESAILFGVYLAILLFFTGQKAFYLDVIRSFKRPPPVEEKGLVSV